MFLIVLICSSHVLGCSLHEIGRGRVGKEIIHLCKIHMVEEKILEGGPKGGGKEKLGEEE